MWMPGGGVKRSFTYGKTDDIGFHATRLQLLGIDDEQLTCKFQGRKYRLTDVAGKVAGDIQA